MSTRRSFLPLTLLTAFSLGSFQGLAQLTQQQQIDFADALETARRRYEPTGESGEGDRILPGRAMQRNKGQRSRTEKFLEETVPTQLEVAQRRRKLAKKKETKLLSKACRAYFRETQKLRKQRDKGKITFTEWSAADSAMLVRYAPKMTEFELQTITNGDRSLEQMLDAKAELVARRGHHFRQPIARSITHQAELTTQEFFELLKK